MHRSGQLGSDQRRAGGLGQGAGLGEGGEGAHRFHDGRKRDCLPHRFGLLYNSIRKLTALLRKSAGRCQTAFRDYCRRAKRRVISIRNSQLSLRRNCVPVSGHRESSTLHNLRRVRRNPALQPSQVKQKRSLSCPPLLPLRLLTNPSSSSSARNTLTPAWFDLATPWSIPGAPAQDGISTLLMTPVPRHDQ